MGTILSARYGRAGSLLVSVRGTALKVVLPLLAVAALVLNVVSVRDLIADRYFFYGRLALYRGDVHTANSLLERAVSLDFFPRLSLYWLGVAKMQLGLYSEALEIFEECLGRYTPEPLYLHLAMLNLKLGKPEEARKHAEFLLSTHPQREVQNEARFIVAQSFMAQSDFGEAKEVLEELLSHSPDFERALILLGEISQRTGDFQEARLYYERALRVVQEKLKRLERKLGGPLPVEKYASLRSELVNLRRLKGILEERLSQLP
ncbi:TPA: tetratricopeptide repeat protein [Candidatus Micrarchaeota archaeon]|nr:tetratricopeptide repeat protein [Candidatus Micrarchaeota archaeon]